MSNLVVSQEMLLEEQGQRHRIICFLFSDEEKYIAYLAYRFCLILVKKLIHKIVAGTILVRAEACVATILGFIPLVVLLLLTAVVVVGLLGGDF